MAGRHSILLLSAAWAQEKIKVGPRRSKYLATILGVDGIAGFNAAVKKYNSNAGGKELEFVIASTDATPDSAVRAVKKLIEQDHVQILISPLSGDEGIAVKNFSKTHPELTFINAASGAQETTFPDPSPNFFRWNMDGAQWSAGLGDYAYNTKGYKKIATVGEDYSFVYTQVFGLVLEYCAAGGQVTNRQWVPLDLPRRSRRCPMTSMRSTSARRADAVNFLTDARPAAGPFMGGSIMVRTVLRPWRREERDARHDRRAAWPTLGTIQAEGWYALSGGDSADSACRARCWRPTIWIDDGRTRRSTRSMATPAIISRSSNRACRAHDRRAERQDHLR